MTGTGAWYEALGVVLESGGEGLVLLHCLEVLSGEEVEEGGEEEDGLVAVGVGDSVDTVVGIEVVEEGVEVELEGGAPLLEGMEVLEAEQGGGGSSNRGDGGAGGEDRGGAALSRGGARGGTSVRGAGDAARGGGTSRGGPGSVGQRGGGGSAGRSAETPVDASPVLRSRAPDLGAHGVREKSFNIYSIWFYFILFISI